MTHLTSNRLKRSALYLQKTCRPTFDLETVDLLSLLHVLDLRLNVFVLNLNRCIECKAILTFRCQCHVSAGTG